MDNIWKEIIIAVHWSRRLCATSGSCPGKRLITGGRRRRCCCSLAAGATHRPSGLLGLEAVGAAAQTRCAVVWQSLRSRFFFFSKKGVRGWGKWDKPVIITSQDAKTHRKHLYLLALSRAHIVEEAAGANILCWGTCGLFLTVLFFFQASFWHCFSQNLKFFISF